MFKKRWLQNNTTPQKKSAEQEVKEQWAAKQQVKKENKEMASRREQEAQKILEETAERRRQAQRELIGDSAEAIHDRKDHIDEAKRLWDAKGKTTTPPSSPGVHSNKHGTATIGASAVSKAKAAYKERLEAFKDKGKSEDHLEAGDLRAPDLDSLKASKPKTYSYQTKKKTPSKPLKKKSEAGQKTGYDDVFETIEKEEITMVGEEKHIKITGMGKNGRRIIRTRIVLPSVKGETQHQKQQHVTAADLAKLEKQ